MKTEGVEVEFTQDGISKIAESAFRVNEKTENIGARYQEATGAKIRGIYFEGPYFTEKYKGAQNPAYMKDPRMDEFRAWQKAANGLLNKNCPCART